MGTVRGIWNTTVSPHKVLFENLKTYCEKTQGEIRRLLYQSVTMESSLVVAL